MTSLFQDQRRDVIREMVMERPATNWMTAENVGQRLTTQFVADLMGTQSIDGVVGDTEWLHSEYPGLPRSGDYETMEGLWRHSDRYFDGLTVSDNEVRHFPKCPK